MKPLRIGLCFLLICQFLFGCSTSNIDTRPTDNTEANTEVISTSNEDGPMLKIKATTDPNVEFTFFSPEELCGNVTEELSYLGLVDVMIDTGEETLRFEDAIRTGKITLAEIFAFARIDAQNGYCTETAKSGNSLHRFIYDYPEYDLWIVYDIYETPDGKQHLISDMGLCANGREPYTIYIDENTGQRIDREDWGLTFEIKELSPTGVTLLSTQEGGLQLGELYIHFYAIDDGTDELLPRIDDTNSIVTFVYPITSDGLTTITIDWTDTFGELSPGNYELILSVEDDYDEEKVHPLMRNYASIQPYVISITLP